MAKAEASVEELVRPIDYGELQQRNDSGVLFFWEAGDALDFQGQPQASVAISSLRKLPWRDRTSGGKRRGRPLKTPSPDSGQTVQIGLVL